MDYEYLPGLSVQKRSMMNLYQKRGAAQDRLNSILAKYKSDPNSEFYLTKFKVFKNLSNFQWRHQKWPAQLAGLFAQIYKQKPNSYLLSRKGLKINHIKNKVGCYMFASILSLGRDMRHQLQ